MNHHPNQYQSHKLTTFNTRLLQQTGSLYLYENQNCQTHFLYNKTVQGQCATTCLCHTSNLVNVRKQVER